MKRHMAIFIIEKEKGKHKFPFFNLLRVKRVVRFHKNQNK